MVAPQFSVWTSFILGGLSGSRGRGEGPPDTAALSDLRNLYHTGRPDITLTLNSSHDVPLSEGSRLEDQDVPKLQTSTSTACESRLPGATADAEQMEHHNATSTTNTSHAKCTLIDSPLSNAEQVGDSIWGTLCQPYLHRWLPYPDGTPYTTAPWGNLTTDTTDPTIHGDVPETNVTRTYNWTLSRSRLSPDGVLRDVILVNSEFPGPLIEANFGDWIEVHIHNNITLPEEGTAIHWHGLLQQQTPWMDGTPGVAQCPIAPGASFTYRFRADVYGTSFWHAHYSAQYTAGAVGPMVIHGPSVREYDIDVGPVMLQDWNHIPYFSMVANVVGTDFSKIPPLSDNGLINGRGRFDCSTPSYSNSSDWLGSYFDSDLEWTCVDDAPRSTFRFQSGKLHRLRLINQGADGVQKFSIDNHTMTVIATDFVPTQPYETDVVTLGVGQRTDVLVKAKENPKTAVWMRTQLPGGPMCGGLGPYGAPLPPLGAPMPPGTVYPDVLAAIYYEDADVGIEPTSTTNLEPQSCVNDHLALTRPAATVVPPHNPYVLDLIMTLARNDTGSFEWRTNNVAYRANYNEPLLYSARDTSHFSVLAAENPEWNVYDLGHNKSIILNVTNATPFTHPMHLHGHTFFVLSVGANGSIWNGSITNAENPMRRDTQIIPAGGFAALQFEGDHAGVWPFHCHAAWHLSSGLAVNLVTRGDEVDAMPQRERERSCEAWSAYSARTVVDQIDSGS